MTQTELRKRAGVSQTTVSDMERGRNATTTNLVAFARALKVSAEWLETGKGRPDAIDLGSSSGPTVHGQVPLISWVRAGEASEAVDAFQPGHGEAWISTTCPIHRHTYALRVEGDSMETKFPAGII